MAAHRELWHKGLQRRALLTRKLGLGQNRVIMRRARLQYESHVEVFVGGDRHGFDVTVPTHGFKIRITCPRVVPENVVGAPWDDLLENVCKIDRSIVKSRNSKSQPLTYVPRHGPHPALRVEVLSRGTPEQGPLAIPGG